MIPMNFRMRVAFIIAVCFFSFGSFAYAQVNLDTSDSVLVLRVTPENPGAFTTVNAELKSFSIDLNRTTVVWSLNGVEKKRGTGEKLFRFETGGFGAPVELRITVTTTDGRVFEKIRQFEPAQVELLWQANSYTPPFYKGKALFPYEGTGVAVALPFFTGGDGKRLPARDLIFTWKENDEVVADASGAGKNVFPLESTIPVRPITLSVVVESADQRFRAEKEVTVSPIAPQLLLYEDHPLYGILFGKTVSDTISLGKELKLAAIPFFFGTSKRGGIFMKYDWSMNQKRLPNEIADTLVMRRINDEGGRALISANATLPDKSLQAAERAIFVTSEAVLGSFGTATENTTTQ